MSAGDGVVIEWQPTGTKNRRMGVQHSLAHKSNLADMGP